MGRGRHSRAQVAALVISLRDGGSSVAAIAAQLGLAHSTVYAYYRDPAGNEVRRLKQRYRGTCADCGAPTTGSRGPLKAPALCRSCSNRRRAPAL